FLGMGFSLPLPLRTTEDQLTAEPLAREAARRAEVEALEKRITMEIATARTSLIARQRYWEQTRGTALTIARDNATMIKESWLNGNDSLLRYRQAEQRVLELERSTLSAQAEWREAWTRWVFVSARNLPPSP
ncbi:MAG: TolC family protein, partial [Verrucomicrobiota bacterium]